jgi:hypothetical protein
MKWTRERPDRPGFYFFREGPADENPHMIEVLDTRREREWSDGKWTKGDGTLEVLHMGVEEIEALGDYSPDVEFLGPILPKETSE